MQIPERLLMGPGPSDVRKEVLAALAWPTIGHLDPVFSEMMDEIKSLLRTALYTENPLTFPVSSPGSAAMEMGLINLLEPGDKVLICSNGVFGKRMMEIARRCRADAVELEFAWGEAVDPQKVADALKQNPGTKVVGFVHAETSTGALSDAESICEVAKKAGALTLVDAVTSFGGVPLYVDKWGIDFLYTGTQKCLSCPPGLAPVSISAEAMEVIAKRKSPVQSWFLDVNLINAYWSPESQRTYHHTAPVNALYGLYESLRLLVDDGLEQSWRRHRDNHDYLAKGLAPLGFEFFVKDPAVRLPQLNSVTLPEGVDEGAIRKSLLANHSIEVGSGLGPLAGKVWRIGLMGHSSQQGKVDKLISALTQELGR